MKGRGYIIPQPAIAEVRETEFDAPVTLQYLKDAVGGYIEIVPGWQTFVPPSGGDPVPCVVFCNEDGKRSLEPNVLATALWHAALKRRVGEDGKPLYPTGLVNPGRGLADYLVGDIVVITGDAELLEEL